MDCMSARRQRWREGVQRKKRERKRKKNQCKGTKDRDRDGEEMEIKKRGALKKTK